MNVHQSIQPPSSNPKTQALYPPKLCDLRIRLCRLAEIPVRQDHLVVYLSANPCGGLNLEPIHSG